MIAEQPERPRIVILISGSGSNMQAIAEACARDEIDAEICAVISNKDGVLGLERAHQAGIRTQVLDHKQYPSREAFDVAMIRAIDEYAPDAVVLAGFMRILTADFVRHYEGRLINIHPSLLPNYKGLHTHQRVLEAGDKQHGVTVHFVTEGLDDGPNIIQAVVPVLAGDDEDSLRVRVQQQEHIIYPIALKWLLEGRLKMQGNKASFDGQPLPASGVQLVSE